MVTKNATRRARKNANRVFGSNQLARSIAIEVAKVLRQTERTMNKPIMYTGTGRVLYVAMPGRGRNRAEITERAGQVMAFIAKAPEGHQRGHPGSAEGQPQRGRRSDPRTQASKTGSRRTAVVVTLRDVGRGLPGRRSQLVERGLVRVARTASSFEEGVPVVRVPSFGR